jgi:hypothetical protein
LTQSRFREPGENLVNFSKKQAKRVPWQGLIAAKVWTGFAKPVGQSLLVNFANGSACGIQDDVLSDLHTESHRVSCFL